MTYPHPSIRRQSCLTITLRSLRAGPFKITKDIECPESAILSGYRQVLESKDAIEGVYFTQMFFVYILRDNSNRLYIGHTSNLERRAREHKSKYGSLHTKGFSDPVVVYSEVFETRSDAASRERQLKGWTRAKKEALILGDIELLKKL